jgi:hypothetical protein
MEPGDWPVELRLPPGSTIEPDPDESVTLRIATLAACGETIMVDRLRPGEMEGTYRGAKRDPGELTKNYALQLDRRTDDGFEVKVSYDKPDGETRWSSRSGARSATTSISAAAPPGTAIRSVPYPPGRSIVCTPPAPACARSDRGRAPGHGRRSHEAINEGVVRISASADGP